MPTRYIKLRGIGKWVKYNKPDTRFNKDGVYTLDLYPDEASGKLYNEVGIQVIPKEDEDGKFVRLRREHQKIINGKMTYFGPIPVTMDGEPFEGLIGNGSDITLDVAVYDTQKGKGHRINHITINNLVKYERPVENDTSSNINTVLSGPTTTAFKPKISKVMPF